MQPTRSCPSLSKPTKAQTMRRIKNGRNQFPTPGNHRIAAKYEIQAPACGQLVEEQPTAFRQTAGREPPLEHPRLPAQLRIQAEAADALAPAATSTGMTIEAAQRQGTSRRRTHSTSPQWLHLRTSGWKLW